MLEFRETDEPSFPPISANPADFRHSRESGNPETPNAAGMAAVGLAGQMPPPAVSGGIGLSGCGARPASGGIFSNKSSTQAAAHAKLSSPSRM